MTFDKIGIFDDSGMLVLPDSIVDVWRHEENIVRCSHCGYSYRSKAVYKIRHTCPRCKEVIC